MSKKIELKLSDVNRPDLCSLFHDYLRNHKLVRGGRRTRKLSDMILSRDMDYDDIMDYWDRMYPGWDTEDINDALYNYHVDEEDGEVLYPCRRGNGRRVRSFDQLGREESFSRNGKKKHKRGGRGKSKAKMVNIRRPYDGYISEEEYSYEDLSMCDGEKKIIFYNDYHDKYDIVEFTSLKEFYDFCENEGYYVPGYEQDDILYRNESHCCLNPDKLREGLFDIVSDNSYGELFYSVCKANELR